VHGNRLNSTGGIAIKTIINKSRRPIRIALPRGKTLHLGPGSLGQVHDDALERPALQKLIEAGEIELLGDESQGSEAPPVDGGKGGRTPRSGGGRAPTKSMERKGGDR